MGRSREAFTVLAVTLGCSTFGAGVGAGAGTMIDHRPSTMERIHSYTQEGIGGIAVQAAAQPPTSEFSTDGQAEYLKRGLAWGILAFSALGFCVGIGMSRTGTEEP